MPNDDIDVEGVGQGATQARVRDAPAGAGHRVEHPLASRAGDEVAVLEDGEVELVGQARLERLVALGPSRESCRTGDDWRGDAAACPGRVRELFGSKVQSGLGHVAVLASIAWWWTCIGSW